MLSMFQKHIFPANILLNTKLPFITSTMGLSELDWWKKIYQLLPDTGWLEQWDRTKTVHVPKTKWAKRLQRASELEKFTTPFTLNKVIWTQILVMWASSFNNVIKYEEQNKHTFNKKYLCLHNWAPEMFSDTESSEFLAQLFRAHLRGTVKRLFSYFNSFTFWARKPVDNVKEFKLLHSHLFLLIIKFSFNKSASILLKTMFTLWSLRLEEDRNNLIEVTWRHI